MPTAGMVLSKQGKATSAVVHEVPKLRSDLPLEKQLDLVRVRYDPLVGNRATLAEQLNKTDAEIARLTKVLEEHPFIASPPIPQETYPR